MQKNNFIICPVYHENGKRTFCVQYESGLVLCELPTLEQAASLARYINGGNMTEREREGVRATLSTERDIYRKAQRKNAAALTD